VPSDGAMDRGGPVPTASDVSLAPEPEAPRAGAVVALLASAFLMLAAAIAVMAFPGIVRDPTPSRYQAESLVAVEELQQLHGPLPAQGQIIPGNGQCGPMEKGATFATENGYHVAGVPSMQVCCARCQAAPACRSWTWVMDAAECWLKSGMVYETLRQLDTGRVLSNLISGNATGRPQLKIEGTQPYPLNWQVVHATPPQFSCPKGPLPYPVAANTGGMPLQLRVLTYNLAWWLNFDKSKPGEVHYYQETQGNLATALVARAGAEVPFDVMAFQECLDVDWLLQKAGLANEYGGLQGSEEICLAYRKSSWAALGSGQAQVAEDQRGDFWRRRIGQWVRLRHMETGKTLFFMNHHGPLPIGTGGACGGVGTAHNLMNLVGAHAQDGDVVILLGDFNAGPNSATVQQLATRLHRLFAGTIDGGIDNIFSNVPTTAVVGSANLGKGGSDHDALSLLVNI